MLGDVELLVALAADTGIFKLFEIEALREVFNDYFAGYQAVGHRCITLDEHNRLLGFAYFAPAAMTVGTWYLWWIVVAKDHQRRGLGGMLLRYVEDEARGAQARHLLIETSSLPHYEPTRRFYELHGYTQVARIPDYYAEGDSLILYRKVLRGAGPKL
jgi:ribosomal protein S18 acetylase RimI-like enzyme